MKRMNQFIMGMGVVIAMTGIAFADDMGTLSSQQFVTKAATAGNDEVREGHLALQKSSNPDVRNFAQLMINAHSAANARLTQLAHNDGLTVPPTNAMYSAMESTGASTIRETNTTAWPYTNNTGVANYKGAPPSGAEALATPAMMTESNEVTGGLAYLSTLSGSEFDKEYAREEVKDHVQAVKLFKKASHEVPQQNLKTFAATITPKLEHHLQMARSLAEKVGANMSASQ